MRSIRAIVAGSAVAGLLGLVACGGGEAGGEADAGAAEMQPAQQQAGGEMQEAGGEMQQGDQQMDLPEGVTPAMIEQGKQIFAGDGLCYACHGQDGKGLPNLGVDLTDDEWVHIDGSYESIIENIETGVTAEQSTSGTPMPPKGGSSITEEQVKAVAAYVWSLSHGGM